MASLFQDLDSGILIGNYVNAWDFDGTNDYLSKASLDGVSDSRKGTITFSINVDTDSSLDRIFYIETGTNDFALRKHNTDNSLILFVPFAGGSSGSAIQIDTPASSVTAAAGWQAVLI